MATTAMSPAAAIAAAISFKPTVAAAIAAAISISAATVTATVAAAVTATVTTSVAAAVTSFTITTAVATPVATAASTAIITPWGPRFARFGLAAGFVFEAFTFVLELVAFFAFKFVFELLGFLGFRLGEFVGQSKFLKSTATGQLDPVAIVDVDYLDLHLVTDVADVVDAANVAAGQFADVAQSIAARENLDECAEVLDAADGAGVDLADLDRRCREFHALQGLFGHGGIVRGNRHFAGIVNVDHGVGFFLDGANVLATRADQHADLFGVDLGDQQTWGMLGNIFRRLRHCRQHLLENLQSRIARLGQGAANDVHLDPANLEIQLDSGDPVYGSGDFEIHIAIMVFITNDVGQQGPGIAFLDQPNRNPGYRTLDLDAGIHQAERGSANGRH
jgi:hypothetical protein